MQADVSCFYFDSTANADMMLTYLDHEKIIAYFFGPRWLGKQKFLGPRTCIIQKYVSAWPARAWANMK